MKSIVEKVMNNSEKSYVLSFMQRLFNFGIPFNLSHKFKFIEVSANKVELKLPFIRHNKNHLGGVHACAIATLGEYTAGLCLMKNFRPSLYRLVMHKLEVEYLKQGMNELTGQVNANVEEFKTIKKELEAKESVFPVMKTTILNSQNEIIAIVTTTWQLKSWNKVTFQNDKNLHLVSV